jgi:hypothetical protein
MGEEKIGVRAVEDDDVQLGVAFDETNELGELPRGRRSDGIDGGMVEGSLANRWDSGGRA